MELDKAQARAAQIKSEGYRYQKWFLAYGPGDGPEGMRKNVDLVRVLRETVGDQADKLLPELSELFQDEGPRLLRAIREAINEAEHQQLAAAAHTLKSSSASLGSQDLPKVCEQLETLGRTGTTIGAAEKIATLDEGYTRFAAVLDLACATLATRT